MSNPADASTAAVSQTANLKTANLKNPQTRRAAPVRHFDGNRGKFKPLARAGQMASAPCTMDYNF
jgi:hypothetical protein